MFISGNTVGFTVVLSLKVGKGNYLPKLLQNETKHLVFLMFNHKSMLKKHCIFTLHYNNPGRLLQIKQNVNAALYY